MAETTSQALICLDCRTEITKSPHGGKKKYCPPCAKERSRAAARDYQRRRRNGGGLLGPKSYVCLDCKNEFVHSRRGSQQPDRCPPCSAAATEEYQLSYRRARGHLEIGTTVTLLCDCGTPFEWLVVLGRRAWKCRRCLDTAYMLKKQRDVVIARLRRPAANLSRTCVDCGDDFEQRHVRGPIIVRCPTCAQGRAQRLHREYGRAMSESLSAVLQVTFAVEGRWSPCLGCGARLPCERMGLVRRWCETCLPARRKTVLAAWKSANPEAWKAIVYRANQARRVRLANVGSAPYDRTYILERDKWTCQICNKKIRRNAVKLHPLSPSIDHQIPLALGGPDNAANAVAAHLGCNRVKGVRYLAQGEQLALIG